MRKLVKNKQLAVNDWQIADADFDIANRGSEKWLLPSRLFLDALETDTIDFESCCPYLDSHDDVRALEPYLHKIQIVGLNFSAFTDGRSFSQARILRDQLDFAGEIRAMGNYLLDQIFYLARCGVNSFLLPEETSFESVMERFDDFGDSYQAACDEPQPLFRRRL